MTKVKDIMYTGTSNAILDEKSCFRDVLKAMNGNHLGAVNIVEKRKLIGIVTDGDIRRLILNTQLTLPELFLKNVEYVMTRNSKTVSPDITLNECLKQFEKYRVWVISVTDKNKKLLGIVHLHELLKAMVIL